MGMPEQVSPVSPRGALFQMFMQAGQYLPVPTTPLHIKFYMNSWVVNQCSEEEGRGRCSKRFKVVFFFFENLYSSLRDVLTHVLV